MSIWDNSSYVDLTGYSVTTATTPEAEFGVTGTRVATGTVTVALVLPRTNDPTTLLGEDWAQREAILTSLTSNQLAATYGASPVSFNAIESYLATVAGANVLGQSNGYVTSAASRTIWVSLDAAAFRQLFNTQLLTSKGGGLVGDTFWDGNLQPSTAIANLAGLWVESSPTVPATAQTTQGVTLQPGPQGVGNTSATVQALYPNQIAAEYNFPLDGDTAVTPPAVGLIEPGVGAAVPTGEDADQALQRYRKAAQVSGNGTLSEGPVETKPTETSNGERALDLGIVAAAAPNSDIVAYNGAGDIYSATQEAIWGGGDAIGTLSSSYHITNKPTPDSPFFAALQGLYEDAALNNITFFDSSGDHGSSGAYATGKTETSTSNDSPYIVTVGGTSTSSLEQILSSTAPSDQQVLALARQAIDGDPHALEVLISGGLTQSPTSAALIADFVQTTWNAYAYNATTGDLKPGYAGSNASNGGVNTAIPEPSYQVNAGIDVAALATADGVPGGLSGKGVPDVSALSSGNTDYTVPTGDLKGTTQSGGTSASAPLWAALTAQIQAVFADQGLPTTGYFNDLLYIAALIDPASFNDVQFGNNTSTYVQGGNGSVYLGNSGMPITPTGLGYTASAGYDLATGLGTPNGILLARALTQIAQAQVYSADAKPVSDATGLTSAANQALILETTLVAGSALVQAAGATFVSAAGSGTGWSARVAQQVLQSYFSSTLVDAIAGQAQAGSTQVTVADGQSLSAIIGGTTASPTGQADTTAFGFVTDTGAAGDLLTYARPLALAETYGGQDGTDAIVRLRQTSADADSLTLYKVDDLLGDIDGIAPGQAGYAQAAANRAYLTTMGETAIAVPAQNEFAQSIISGVDNGDLIGFELTDATTGQQAWGLAPENMSGKNALWSYGADTWGFNDGSDDGSYAATVFQLDFTSESGQALLATDTTTACYCPGTLILTNCGERSVEGLAIGDTAVTAAGEHRTICWLGRRSYARRFLAANPAVQPICFRAGSLGGGLPRRDLLVSPEHAIFLDGVLIPARHLENGSTIVQQRVEQVDYYHVELDTHDVLLAEGAPAESFLPTGTRGQFNNAAEHAAFYPGINANPDACAPLVEHGPELEAVRARLVALAGQVAMAA